jgi:hypothetical protein
MYLFWVITINKARGKIVHTNIVSPSILYALLMMHPTVNVAANKCNPIDKVFLLQWIFKNSPSAEIKTKDEVITAAPPISLSLKLGLFVKKNA